MIVRILCGFGGRRSGRRGAADPVMILALGSLAFLPWFRKADGPVDKIVVSLADQAFVAYSDGRRVMRGPVCTGRRGYRTRAGKYRVTNKHRHWVSTIYGVPMPHFLRLNGGPVGLHGGFLPGFPASHGCIRLAYEDAGKLFKKTPRGTRVYIVSESRRDTRGVKQPERKRTKRSRRSR